MSKFKLGDYSQYDKYITQKMQSDFENWGIGGVDWDTVEAIDDVKINHFAVAYQQVYYYDLYWIQVFDVVNSQMREDGLNTRLDSFNVLRRMAQVWLQKKLSKEKQDCLQRIRARYYKKESEENLSNDEMRSFAEERYNAGERVEFLKNKGWVHYNKIDGTILG